MTRSRPPFAAAACAWPAPVALLLTLAALPAAADSAAPVPAVPDPLAFDQKVLAEARGGSEIMANLTYLSDVIGPRLTGSAANKRACEWAADKMKGYGLQDVHLEGWTIPVGWERGPASVRIVEPDNGRQLTVAAMGWTPGTGGKVGGEVMLFDAKDSASLARYKGKLKGKVVLRGAPAQIRPVTEKGFAWDAPASPRDRPARNGQAKPADKPAGDGPKAGAKGPESPEARAMAAVAAGADPMKVFERMQSFRREAGDFLRQEGAVAVLTDAGKPHGLLTTTGGWRGNDRASGPDPVPALFVAHEHYAQLYRLATRPAPAVTRVEVEVQNKIVPGPVPVYNVVGEIRGAERPDEYVVLGAHIDSWDLAQGTTDNGTGTCVVLEAARTLAKSGARPKRTIRFCLFSGEEQGLYGSREYVKKHEKELPRTSMALVHDTGTGRVTGIGLQGRPAIKPILDAELSSLKEVGPVDVNTRSMGGSDHQSFDSKGVPGFAFQQDPAEYRFSHHSQSDTLDKAREPDLIQGAQVMAVTGLHVANLPNLLPRDKPARERPARAAGDRSKAEEKPAPKKTPPPVPVKN